MDLKKAREILKVMPGVSPMNLLMGTESCWVFRDLLDEPHAILTSGKHSDGYFNVSQATSYSNVCKYLGTFLKQKFDECINLAVVDAVVSSSYAALPIGMELARQLGAMFVFTEKEEKEQVWTGRFELLDEAILLQVEDLITTMGTVEKVQKAVKMANPKAQFVRKSGKDVVMTVVHRPERLMAYPDYQVVALIEQEVHSWEPEKCPLCKKSEALKPKPNWARFQASIEYYNLRKSFDI